MSTNIRCPRCGRLNPTPAAEAAKEHTCIFCGAIMPPQPADRHAAKGKDHTRRFPLAKSESKPINKNQRKPML